MAYDHGRWILQARKGPASPTRRGPRRAAMPACGHHRGRVLLTEILPRGCLSLVNRVMGKEAARRSDRRLLPQRRPERRCSGRSAALAGVHPRDHGRHLVSHRGHEDSPKKVLLDQRKRRSRRSDQYNEGLITDGERYNKVVDIWAQVAEQVTGEMMNEDRHRVVSGTRRTGAEKPAVVQPHLHHGRLGRRKTSSRSASWPVCAALMAKPSGEIIETPITPTSAKVCRFSKYFISTHGARKGSGRYGAEDRQLRLPDPAPGRRGAGRDHRRLRLRHAGKGIEMTPLVEGGEIIGAWRPHLGRVALEDVMSRTPATSSSANDGSPRRRCRDRELGGIDKVKIRSVLTCQTRRGICVQCYGRDLARGCWSTSAKRSASSRRSRSASRARS